MSICVGMRARAESVVTNDNVAISAGSGTLPVFATPCMCALMEEASWKAIAPELSQGDSSVGTKLSISHISASPVGIKVWAESEVTAVDGKRIEFKVAAYDEAGLIGEGTHERFIITSDRFLAKTEKKLKV